MNYRKIIAFLMSIVMVWSLCFAAFAEEPAAENETGPEEEEWNFFSAEIIEHRLWGFFCGWAEQDLDRLMYLCASAWKKGKEDPRQAMAELLKTGRLHGYRVNSVSGEDTDPVRTATVLLQWETEGGGYKFRLHEIACLREADGYLFDPDGIASGTPADPVPEEELILLTPEGIIRNGIGLHEGENLYDQLIPVNAAAEKQGIRVEVISGLVEGTNAWFMISLQDTEGKYDGYELEPSFADNIDQASYSKGWSHPYYDREKRIYYYFVCQELSRPMRPEEGTVSAGVDMIRVNRTEKADLLPLLKQYGKTEEGVIPPKLEKYRIREDAPEMPADIRVLDYDKPLDVPLYGDICLAGIGWIGDQLHVQFRNKGSEYLEMRNGRAGTWSAWIDASVSGRSYGETYVGYSPLEWDGNDNGWTDWSEYLINCKPEETDQLEISAEITVTGQILDDGWTVQIPLDRICAASDD